MISATSESKNVDSHSNTKQSNIVAVSGSTGLVGSAVCGAFEGSGDRVLRLVRSEQEASINEIRWNPDQGMVNTGRMEGIDAIVHLAGENIADGRWTETKKQRIHSSRVDGTRKLCEQITKLIQPPQVLLTASAIGFYGDRGDIELTEHDDAGTGFLADVCREWEAATEPAAERGVRVVNLRIGVIISRDGGALPQMLTPFRLGVGGKIGSGRQYWSWVHLHDAVGAIRHCIDHPELSGPVNCVAPTPVTNSEFTTTLGSVLSRPTLFPMPGFAARLALGQMANDLLLSSTRVVPRKLLDSGYQFVHSNLEPALKAEVA